jgi:hypothetical protein
MSFATLNAPITLADVGSLEDFARSFPAGTYPVRFTNTELEPVKGNPNSGKAILTGTILDGEHKGLEASMNLNIFHESSEKAREIARQHLYKIACCAGHPLGAPLANLGVIGQRPVIVTFAVQIDKNTGKPHEKGYTEFKGVTDVNGGKPYLAGQSAHVPAQAPAAPQVQAQPQAPQAPAQAGGWGAPAAQAPAAQAAAGWGAPSAAPTTGGWGG